MLVLFSQTVLSQKGYADKINQYNAKGQKEGLWKENTGQNWRTETYYHNGKRNGIFKELSISRGELITFGEYRNDTIAGTWCYFGDYGHLMMIQNDFQKNTYPTPAIHHVQEKEPCPFRCYCIEYYPNGNKESEGILLWDDDPESDFTFEYGEWKYYNEDGTLKETKVFK